MAHDRKPGPFGPRDLLVDEHVRELSTASPQANSVPGLGEAHHHRPHDPVLVESDGMLPGAGRRSPGLTLRGREAPAGL